jgi:hypothetical protein
LLFALSGVLSFDAVPPQIQITHPFHLSAGLSPAVLTAAFSMPGLQDLAVSNSRH